VNASVKVCENYFLETCAWDYHGKCCQIVVTPKSRGNASLFFFYGKQYFAVVAWKIDWKCGKTVAGKYLACVKCDCDVANVLHAAVCCDCDVANVLHAAVCCDCDIANVLHAAVCCD